MSQMWQRPLAEGRKGGGAEIRSGRLVCKKNHEFPVAGGVPRLVVDKAETFVRTEDSFTAKWKKYNKTYHGKKWFERQKAWFLERFGYKDARALERFLDTRTRILDAGTGVGNSAKLFSSNPRADVFAIDASESVVFAYRKYGSAPNIHFLQADIRKPPFRKNFFDFVCSDQVLHHTKDTAGSFGILAGLLARGGIISIYVYKIKGPLREFADTFIRRTTINMSEKECAEFSRDMAVLGRSLSKIGKKITIPRDIPVLQIKKGTYDIQRFIYWNFLKCWWSGDVPFEQSVATNFDWYFPEYAYRHMPDEVRGWFRDRRLRIIHFDEIESGVSVSGRK